MDSSRSRPPATRSRSDHVSNQEYSEVAALLEEFGVHLADDLDTSERTAEFYKSDLREFARFLEGRGVEAIDDLGVGEVMAFRNHLLESQRKSFTVYRKDAAVRRFLNWVRTATDSGFDIDPIEPMHQPLDQKIMLLENEEADQLLSFEMRKLYDARDAAVICLMLDTGATVSEIQNVLREDVDLRAGQTHLGGPDRYSHLSPRTLGLSEETVERLREYLTRRDDGTPELVIGRAARPVTTSKSLQNAIYKRCDQVGLWRISPMVLRHTFAVRLLRRGYSLGQLKDALGVRDTTNIGVYKKFV